ncbi:MAG: hypothetical protein LBU34_16585 [Planctomycetaceae bacterium]|nr:hypothetical protein [Planctomycetaceae bacterium]
MPIGNQNNQYCINSLSANADAIVRRNAAYLLFLYRVGKFRSVGCFVRKNEVGNEIPYSVFLFDFLI